MTYEEFRSFFPARLAQLRKQKGLSPREMSSQIEQSGNYIYMLESGNSDPSMKAFLIICDYLEIEPQDFFGTVENPAQIKKLIEAAKVLDDENLSVITFLAEKLKDK